MSLYDPHFERLKCQSSNFCGGSGNMLSWPHLFESIVFSWCSSPEIRTELAHLVQCDKAELWLLDKLNGNLSAPEKKSRKTVV